MRAATTALALALLVAGPAAGEPEPPRNAEPPVEAAPDFGRVEADATRLLDREARAVVALHFADGTGSGVVVSPEGLILTAAHVAGAAGRRAAVHFPDGRIAAAETLPSADAEAAGDSDVGRVQILPGAAPVGGYPHVDLAAAAPAQPAPGDVVFALGHPGGFAADRPRVIRLGRVIRVTRFGIQTDTALLAGDSGGGLFARDGRLLGCHARIGSTLRSNYHTPLSAYVGLDGADAAPTGEASTGTQLPRDRDRQGAWMLSGAAEAVAGVHPSVAAVQVDGLPVALATAAAPGGVLVTKASELALAPGGAAAVPVPRALSVRLPDGRVLPAVLLGRDAASDLAVLRVDAELPPVRWAVDAPGAGRVVVAAGPTPHPVGVGLISTPSRDIPSRARLGVVFARLDRAAVLRAVREGGAADRAGLRPGDRVLSVAGTPTQRPIDVPTELRRHLPGTTVAVRVRRGGSLGGGGADAGDGRAGRDLTFNVALEAGPGGASDRAERMNETAGPMSVRRSGFRGVIEHDTVIRPRQCGGPLVALDGGVVGINIARAGRIRTLALPASTVRRVVADVLSGSDAGTIQAAVDRP